MIARHPRGVSDPRSHWVRFEIDPPPHELAAINRLASSFGMSGARGFKIDAR